MKRLIALFTLVAFAPFASGLIWIAPARFATSGGGGSPAWYQSIDPASTTSNAPNSLAGQIYGGIVTPTASGTCTKISVYFGNVFATDPIKYALLTTGGTILGYGTVTPTVGTNRWEDLTISSPPSVTSGTTYVIMWMQSAGTASGRYAAASNQGRENYDQVYSTFPTGTVSLYPDNNQMCVRMEVTP